MQYFNTKKSSYEEIDPPVQRRGQQRFLVNLLLVLGFAVCVLLIFQTFTFANSRRKVQLQRSGISDQLIVKVEQGQVLGKVEVSRAGREFLTFLGIPYAKPPLGDLRFEPPVKADSWEGILDATKFKPECPQREKQDNEFRGNEDCLYLNVYTPKTLESLTKLNTRPFPVMLHIHGGGDTGNATKYGPEYFMDEEVVLVSFHYRIGALGNLNTNDMNARGNQGLKDHVMTLRWIQTNIHNFGGNPDKVTIFGNSGGAMHLTTHLLSPMSKGLFHRGIAESGVLTMPQIFGKHPLKQATELGIKLNCNVSSTTTLVECLRSRSAEDLTGTSHEFSSIATTVEPPSVLNDVILTDTPLKLVMEGRLNRVPVIFGIMASEALHFSLPVLSSPDLTEAYNENWAELGGKALWLDTSPTLQDPERIANAARDFYLGSNNLSREMERNFTEMLTDRRNTHPASVFSSYQLRENKRENMNVYRFYFTEPVEMSSVESKLESYGTNESLGPAHGDELQFLFTCPPFPLVPVGSKKFEFSQMLVRLWVSFAETGIPTGTTNGVEWLPMSEEKPYEWFELSHEPKMTHVLTERLKFWDSFNLTDLYV